MYKSILHSAIPVIFFIYIFIDLKDIIYQPL